MRKQPAPTARPTHEVDPIQRRTPSKGGRLVSPWRQMYIDLGEEDTAHTLKSLQRTRTPQGRSARVRTPKPEDSYRPSMLSRASLELSINDSQSLALNSPELQANRNEFAFNDEFACGDEDPTGNLRDASLQAPQSTEHPDLVLQLPLSPTRGIIGR